MARVRLAPRATDLAAGFAAIRVEQGMPTAFPPEVEAAAEEAATRRPRHTDRTDVPFVTIDPPGSRDLDQALHLERRGNGFRLRYAIADAAAFVDPGGPLDTEARRRGLTLYAPDGRIPLHPDAIGEGAASLLPGEDRPAVLWTFDLDSDAEPTTTRVERATVRSRAALDYPTVQREPAPLLEEFGRLREHRERDRGGVSLHTPSQEVVKSDGGYDVAYVAPLPVENWNAQVSLLTGMAAARIMLDGGVGLLRTMPPPEARAVHSLRRSAHGLGVGWPKDVTYAAFIRGLDPNQPRHAALLHLARTLLRGAGYTAFDGAPPATTTHSAIAAPYAHATAPLRRLADRFVNEVVLALHDGGEVPGWCRGALPELPRLMAAADHRERELDRAILDYVEAAVLAPRVGETFDGVVVEPGLVQVAQPAVRAPLDGDAPLGERVTVRLVLADPVTRRVRFATGA